MGQLSGIIALIVCLLTCGSQSILATELPKSIAQVPSAPPIMTQRALESPFTCERKFLYRGRLLDTDTPIRQDGENLRPILREVPDAIAELDAYQRGRNQVRTLAYVGTFGLALTSSSFLFINPPAAGAEGISTRNLLMFIGLGITASTILYGYSFLQKNEARLENAVRHYNEARPADPIQLQFSTEIGF